MKIRKFKEEDEDDDSENAEQMHVTNNAYLYLQCDKSNQIMTNISKRKYHMFQDLVTEQSMKQFMDCN